MLIIIRLSVERSSAPSASNLRPLVTISPGKVTKLPISANLSANSLSSRNVNVSENCPNLSKFSLEMRRPWDRPKRFHPCYKKISIQRRKEIFSLLDHRKKIKFEMACRGLW